MPVTSAFGGAVRKRRVSPVTGSAHAMQLVPMLTQSPLALPAWSVCTHSRPKSSNHKPSGAPKSALPFGLSTMLPAYCAAGVLVVCVSPHCTNRSHVNDVAVTDFPASRQRMMWPYRLLARGLAASIAGRAEPAAVEPSAALLLGVAELPRRLLLVSVQ